MSLIINNCQSTGCPKKKYLICDTFCWDTLYLVKITDDLIQESDALQPLLVDVVLSVELLVVGDGGEHDTDVVILLRVELVRSPALQIVVVEFKIDETQLFYYSGG